jgi:hypothetical protein
LSGTLDSDRTPSGRLPDKDISRVKARLEALCDAKDETIAELRSRVESLEHQLNVRHKEIRWRDAARRSSTP